MARCRSERAPAPQCQDSPKFPVLGGKKIDEGMRHRGTPSESSEATGPRFSADRRYAQVSEHLISILVEWMEREVKGQMLIIDNKLDDLRALLQRRRMPRASVSQQRCSGLFRNSVSHSAVSSGCTKVDVDLPTPDNGCISTSSGQSHSPEKVSVAKESLPNVRFKGNMERPTANGAVIGAANVLKKQVQSNVRNLARSGSTANLVTNDSSNMEHMPTAVTPPMTPGGPVHGNFSYGLMSGNRISTPNELLYVIAAHQNVHGQCAASMWRFLEDRYSSSTAYLYASAVAIFLVFSVLASLTDAVAEYPFKHPYGQVVQSAFEIIFLLELSVRFLVCPDRWYFVKDVFFFFDVVSIVPIIPRVFFLVMQPEDENNMFSKLNPLVPVVRVLKLMRRFEAFRLLVHAFSIALEALPVLLYTLFLIALLFSSLIYYTEPEDIIENLPSSLYFVLITMTTVGYGDVSPVTTSGKMVTTTLTIISSLYMAIPLGIVGNAFAQVWDARDRLLLMKRIRGTFLYQGFTFSAMKDIFNVFDKDGDGKLDIIEFNKLLRAMHIEISDERVAVLMDSFNAEGEDGIDMNEFLQGLFGHSDNMANIFLSKKHTVFEQSDSTLTKETNSADSRGARIGRNYW